MVRRTVAAVCVAVAAVVAGGCGAAAPAATTGAQTAATGAAATAATGAAATGTAATGTTGAAAGGAAGAPDRGRQFQSNPAIQAAGQIVRVASVVPFSKAQVKKLVPMLQALAKKPNQSSAALTADAKKITAVFSKLQNEALKNMAHAHFTNGGAPPTGTFRRPPATGTTGSTGGATGSTGSTGSTNAARRPPAGARHFSPSSIYQLAINVLEGKATPGSFFGRGAPSGGTASAGSTQTTTGTA